MKNAYWIWYPGDFEIYHGLQQNFSREERGFDWPAYWYMDDCRKNIKFLRTYHLTEESDFTVYSHSSGYILVNGEKNCFNQAIHCKAGEVKIEIFAGQITGVPSVYVEGNLICSDKGWEVTDFVSAPVKVGYSQKYSNKLQNPSIWEFEKATVLPVVITKKNGGMLYDFKRELTAELKIQFLNEFYPITLCYGESETEAIDVKNCYYSQKLLTTQDVIRKRAFRYVFIPEMEKEDIRLEAEHFYVDIPVKASFSCNDEEVNQIWNISEETFRLCSGIFFIDGVKRDRWIWSGDAYQSYFVNQYLMFDEEINKRTIWALRGNDPVRQHINTIVDYSMYWIISIYNHYHMTGDMEFVQMIYPKMSTMMEFLEQQLDENGFIVGREGDWIFIDWSEIDKEGPVCAEQMLLAMCYKTMEQMNQIIGSISNYHEKYERLLEKIDKFYWLDSKKAYIDSFVSGKQHISRHANIFAILFDFVDGRRCEEIYQHVLCNENIPQITTPYFKFYELEVLCKLGKLEEVMCIMKDYWGGIIKEDAVCIWEEYDPKKVGAEHYEMYGDPYGKSLCHAWGASPIYLIGKYFMGLQATDVAYEKFQIKPDTSLFSNFSIQLPIKDGFVKISWDSEKLSVYTDKEGGTLIYQNQEIDLDKGREHLF